MNNTSTQKNVVILLDVALYYCGRFPKEQALSWADYLINENES